MEFMQAHAPMSALRILSTSNQIAAHLRGEIARGRWSGMMPGRKELARQYEVGITSMEEALRELEKEGVIASQGTGRMRRITGSARNIDTRRLRIAVLGYERSSPSEPVFSEAIHVLREAGHDAFFTRSSLVDLGMNVRRVAGLVGKTEADAWIVCAAPRQAVEWFASRSKPSFSLFGRRRGVPIASVGADKRPAVVAAVRRLIDLGHTRIVMLCRPDRRLPVPGTVERAFLAELDTHGITSGPYHLPDWEDGMNGFQTTLESLFRVTPPTALIVDELKMFVATQQFLVMKKLNVPGDVSLVSMESDPAFDWCHPTIACIHWAHQPVMRRVVGWANNVARGKIDRRETHTLAEFIDGGTIGPAKR
jgi:DNA-binding LacI/PurR family transcriptional regulator/ribosomal protein S25